MARTIFLVVVFLNLFWIPVLTIVLVDTDRQKWTFPREAYLAIYLFGHYKQHFESFNLRRAEEEFSQELPEGTALQIPPISSCRRIIGCTSKSECCRHGTIALIERYCWKRIGNLGCFTLNSLYLQYHNWPDVFSYLNIECQIITRSAYEAFFV